MSILEVVEIVFLSVFRRPMMSRILSKLAYIGGCCIIIGLAGCAVVVTPSPPLAQPAQDLRIQVDVFYGPDSYRKAYATIYDNGVSIGDNALVYIDGYGLSYDYSRSEYSAVLGSTRYVNDQ